MKAMQLREPSRIVAGSTPLALVDLPVPTPGPGEVRVRVSTCGVCHTELDEIEGRATPPRLPIVPGHQVVGTIDARGAGVTAPAIGERVGVAWIHSACGACPRCAAGEENLCDRFAATGLDRDGGYAEFVTAPAAFVHPIPPAFSDVEAAPLLCAGAIGYRTLRLAAIGEGRRLGLTGFGASARLVLQLVRHLHPHVEVFVFARHAEERAIAMREGAAWAGDTAELPPAPLDAILDTTPAWKPVVSALAHLRPGGRLVINAIRKEDGDRDELLRLDYPRHLWREKEIKSVANVTRSDVREFLRIAAEAGIRTDTETYALEDANRALQDMKAGPVRAAKVLVVAGR